MHLQALTECHHVLLREGRLHMVNRISGALVQDITLTGPRASPVLGSLPALGLAADHAAGSLYLFTGVHRSAIPNGCCQHMRLP